MADRQKLGRYDIIRVLGKGAMGVVYAGVDPNLERQVAIKTIRLQTLSAEAAAEFEGRFRTEARSAARLHHPNIVSVFDSGQDADTTFLVMELIEGQDLKHHLEAGARFSVRTALLMVHDLLLALEHAHQQKVVHRDVKPANILIEANGRVKLTDFGVARIQDPEESGHTQVGGSVGTPRYMAPEQAKGLRGDARSDLFSAAVVLYELLTGDPPFRGENSFVIIHQINSFDPPPPSSIIPELPAALDGVLQKGLAKDPAHRFATAREFALALRAVVKAMPTTDGDTHVRTRLRGEGDSFQDGSSTSIFGPDDALASTSPTRPHDEADTETLVQPAVDAQPPAPSTPTASTRTVPVWVLWVAGAAALAAVGWGATQLRAPGAGVAGGPQQAQPTQPVEEIIVPSRPSATRASQPDATGAAVAPASQVTALPARSAATPPLAASAPVRAQRPVRAASAPVLTTTEPPVAEPAAPPARPRNPEAARRPANVAGPSASGEVCADRNFLLRIPCVARQCNTERYRHSAECIEFREMERQREESREFRR